MKNTVLYIALFIPCLIIFSIIFPNIFQNKSKKDSEYFKKEIMKLCEKSYFEGQKDAINGDIRIKINSDSTYIWIKSCWDDGTKPIYIPTYLDSKINN